LSDKNCVYDNVDFVQENINLFGAAEATNTVCKANVAQTGKTFIL